MSTAGLLLYHVGFQLVPYGLWVSTIWRVLHYGIFVFTLLCESLYRITYYICISTILWLGYFHAVFDYGTYYDWVSSVWRVG